MPFSRSLTSSHAESVISEHNPTEHCRSPDRVRVSTNQRGKINGRCDAIGSFITNDIFKTYISSLSTKSRRQIHSVQKFTHATSRLKTVFHPTVVGRGVEKTFHRSYLSAMSASQARYPKLSTLKNR